MKRAKLAAAGVAALVLLAFAYFIWPTPYWYEVSGEPFVVRGNRATGEICFLVIGGDTWECSGDTDDEEPGAATSSTPR